MRRPFLAATAATAAAALIAIPALAFSQGSAAADAVGFPVKDLLPMKIQTPKAALALGGSEIRVSVGIVPTGNQGFSKPILVGVCVGTLGCKSQSVRTNRNGPYVANLKFSPFDILQGPTRASIQVMAQTESFKTTAKNFVVTAR